MAPSFFTGDAGKGYRTERSTGWDVPSDARADGVVTGTASSSALWQTNDPRIDGRATYVGTEVDYREGALRDSPTGLDGVVRAMLTRVVNDPGAWEGTLVSLEMDAVALEMTSGWLVGEGDYEGLMAYVMIDFTTADCCVINGHITSEGRPRVPETFPEGSRLMPARRRAGPRSRVRNGSRGWVLPSLGLHEDGRFPLPATP